MASITENLQALTQDESAIRAALAEKGVQSAGGFDNFASEISSIEMGAQVDREGLAALGYNEEEIELFQEIGAFEPVPEWNISEAGKSLVDVRKDVFYMPKSCIEGVVATNITFQEFFSLKAFVSKEIETVQNEFTNCRSLKGVNLPALSGAYRGFSSLIALEIALIHNCTTLSSSDFFSSHNLTTITLPKIERIGDACFTGSRTLITLDLSAVESVPVLNDIDAFASVHAEFKILVPMALLPAFQSATNWSTYADRMIGV